MAPPPPPLVDDLVEEVLIRFQPDDPSALVRASLVCKAWRRLVSSPGFRRRLREFHQTGAMLGFLYCWARRGAPFRFESITSFRPRYPDAGDGEGFERTVDARRGLVLLSRYSPEPMCEDLVVWDPIRGSLRALPRLHHWCCSGWTAALVCTGCADDAPFRVVFVGTDLMLRFVTSVCVYSSEVGAWSKHSEFTAVPPTITYPTNLATSALVGNTLYFRCATGILEHNLDTQTSVVKRAPAVFVHEHSAVVTTADDGRLGFAVIEGSKLFLWSTGAGGVGSGEDAGWAHIRVIELSTLLPANALLDPLRLVGSADCIGAILVRAADQLFVIDLKSTHVREIGKGLDLYDCDVVPYVGF